LLLYVYGVIGYHFFHLHDPAHWGTLGRSLLTLFQMLTLEGWIEVRQTSLQAYPWAWIYYGSYIVIAVFIVINLFVAVVLNNMENARLEYELAENNVTHGMSCWPAFAL
jgi:voltage-gated sodium channel